MDEDEELRLAIEQSLKDEELRLAIEQSLKCPDCGKQTADLLGPDKRKNMNASNDIESTKVYSMTYSLSDR